MRCVRFLAAVILVWAVPLVPAVAQEGSGSESRQAGTDKEDSGKPKKNLQIVIDSHLDEDLKGVELTLQLAVVAAQMEGKTADLKEVEKAGLEVAKTNRQKAYVYLRIAQMYYERGDDDSAIEFLKRGLPLADGDRSKNSLYFKILRGLVALYSKTGRFRESMPYRRIYQEIVSARIDPWERPEGTQDVIHKPTGIRLPQKLNIFKRMELVVYDDTGRDAGANYRVEEGQLPLLSVYLVANFKEGAEEHFNGSMIPLLDRFDGEKVLSRGPISVETDKGTVEGFAGLVFVPAGGQWPALGSDLYVFVRKGTLIKFRISFRARNRKKIEGVMHDIFKTFDWP